MERGTSAAMQVRELHTFIRKTSYFESVVHLLKANLGAGVFAMGAAFKQAGILIGLFGTITIGFVCAYNAHLLVSCAQMIKQKLQLEYLPNFPETVELCFLHGPPAARKWTGFVRKAVKWSIISTQIGFCAIYLIFVARTSQAMLAEEYDFLLKDIRFFIVLVSIFILFTAMIPSLKILTPVSLISNILLITGMLVTLVMCFKDGLPSITSRTYAANVQTWPIFYGTALFAFEGIAIGGPENYSDILLCQTFNIYLHINPGTPPNY